MDVNIKRYYLCDLLTFAIYFGYHKICFKTNSFTNNMKFIYTKHEAERIHITFVQLITMFGPNWNESIVFCFIVSCNGVAVLLFMCTHCVRQFRQTTLKWKRIFCVCVFLARYRRFALCTRSHQYTEKVAIGFFDLFIYIFIGTWIYVDNTKVLRLMKMNWKRRKKCVLVYFGFVSVLLGIRVTFVEIQFDNLFK